MNKKEYIKSYSKKFNVSYKTAEKQINNFYDHLIDESIENGNVRTPIGSFVVSERLFNDNLNKKQIKKTSFKFVLSQTQRKKIQEYSERKKENGKG